MLDLKIVCKNEKYVPAYANETDACMDLKVVVDYTMPEIEETTEGKPCIVLEPKSAYTFSSGIQVAVPKDHVMMIFPRSSTGFKLSCMLANSTGIVDDGFKELVKIKLYNYGEEPVEIVDGQRVAQFMIIPRPKINLIKVEDDEEFRKGDRGGGIGSTGK